MMTSQTGSQQPVILLIDKAEAADSLTIKQWLEENEYLTREASDVFGVIEEISDFTVRRCPDVILLEIEIASQDFVEKMFQNSIDANTVKILSYLSKDHSPDDKLSRIKAEFDKLLPVLARAA